MHSNCSVRFGWTGHEDKSAQHVNEASEDAIAWCDEGELDFYSDWGRANDGLSVRLHHAPKVSLLRAQNQQTAMKKLARTRGVKS